LGGADRLDAEAQRLDTFGMASGTASLLWKLWYPLLTRLLTAAFL
jgi:hypothetical protein